MHPVAQNYTDRCKSSARLQHNLGILSEGEFQRLVAEVIRTMIGPSQRNLAHQALEKSLLLSNFEDDIYETDVLTKCPSSQTEVLLSGFIKVHCLSRWCLASLPVSGYSRGDEEKVVHQGAFRRFQTSLVDSIIARYSSQTRQSNVKFHQRPTLSVAGKRVLDLSSILAAILAGIFTEMSADALVHF